MLHNNLHYLRMSTVQEWTKIPELIPLILLSKDKTNNILHKTNKIFQSEYIMNEKTGCKLEQDLPTNENIWPLG